MKHAHALAVPTVRERGGGSGPPVPTLYEGLIADRLRFPTTSNGGNKQMMSRSGHRAAADISALTVCFGNYRLDQPTKGRECGNGGAAEVQASIEYPVGTFTRLTFPAGSQIAGDPERGNLPAVPTTGAEVAGEGHLWTDYLPIAIPQGEIFHVRCWYANASGILYCGTGTRSTARGDALTVGATAPNQVMGGTVAQSTGSVSAGPVAIVGMTDAPSACLIGDSIMYGLNQTAVSDFRVGIIGTSLPEGLPFVNLGMPGAEPGNFVDRCINRAELFPLCSHMVNNLGINNLTGAASYNAAIAADFPERVRRYLCTVTPRTTSTDSWTTEANQSPSGAVSAQAYNALVRAGVAGYDAYIETCRDWMEGHTLDSYVWRVDGVVGKFTSDGLHPNTAANEWGRDNGKVPAALWAFP